MKVTRWVAAISLSLGLLSSPAFAKGGQHKNLRPVNSSSKVHHRPRIGAKQPKSLGTERRIGNKTGNVETGEAERNIQDAPPSGDSN